MVSWYGHDGLATHKRSADFPQTGRRGGIYAPPRRPSPRRADPGVPRYNFSRLNARSGIPWMTPMMARQKRG